MPALTRTALLAQVKTEARVNDSNLDTAVGIWLDEAMDNCFSQNRCYELKVVNQSLACTADSGIVPLPANFQHVDQVRFSVDLGVNTKKLFPKNDLVKDEKTGIPRFYEMQGSNLYIFPFSLVVDTHVVVLDYYAKPAFTATTDIFPVPRFQSHIIQTVVARIEQFFAKLSQSQASATGAQAAVTAAMDAAHEQRTLDPSDTRMPNPAVPANTE